MRPHKERHTEPGHAGGAHSMNGDDKIEARQNRRKAVDEDAQARRHDVGIRVSRAVWCIESPTRIHPTHYQGIQGQAAADHVNVPTQEVNARQREVFGPNHQRQDKVAENGRNRGNQEEKDHDDAVLCKHPVIGGRLYQVRLRRQ